MTDNVPGDLDAIINSQIILRLNALISTLRLLVEQKDLSADKKQSFVALVRKYSALLAIEIQSLQPRLVTDDYANLQNALAQLEDPIQSLQDHLDSDTASPDRETLRKLQNQLNKFYDRVRVSVTDTGTFRAVQPTTGQVDKKRDTTDVLSLDGDEAESPEEKKEVAEEKPDSFGGLPGSPAALAPATPAPVPAAPPQQRQQSQPPKPDSADEPDTAASDLDFDDDGFADLEPPEPEPEEDQVDDTVKRRPTGLAERAAADRRLREEQATRESDVTQPHQRAVPDPNAVKVAAYYPKEIKPDDWQPLKAYIFRTFAADKVADDAGKQLGGLIATMRKVIRSVGRTLQDGATITITPTLPGFQFNPPQAVVGFYEEWHRADFKLRAVTAEKLVATNGTLTFSVEGVIVADLPLSVYVTDTPSTVDSTHSSEAKLYQSIFCSYSHDDAHIVERVERAYKALGMEFLRDVHSLKAGEDWDNALIRLIEKADIFQLFWSSTAATSDHVRREWEHATKLQREAFIRPVYWEQPMPPVPPALNAVHFAFQPDLVK